MSALPRKRTRLGDLWVRPSPRWPRGSTRTSLRSTRSGQSRPRRRYRSLCAFVSPLRRRVELGGIGLPYFSAPPCEVVHTVDRKLRHPRGAAARGGRAALDGREEIGDGFVARVCAEVPRGP